MSEERESSATALQKLGPRAVCLFYDGHCNLCAGLVQFAVRRDTRKRIHFASLQSVEAEPVARLFAGDGYDTIVCLCDGAASVKSTAAITVLRHLPPPWPFVACMISLLPLRLRDMLYDFVGRNRYRWFGRRESCHILRREYENRGWAAGRDPRP